MIHVTLMSMNVLFSKQFKLRTHFGGSCRCKQSAIQYILDQKQRALHPRQVRAAQCQLWRHNHTAHLILEQFIGRAINHTHTVSGTWFGHIICLHFNQHDRTSPADFDVHFRFAGRNICSTNWGRARARDQKWIELIFTTNSRL